MIDVKQSCTYFVKDVAEGGVKKRLAEAIVWKAFKCST